MKSSRPSAARSKKVYDEVHGYIEVGGIALDLLDLEIFQRLRRIKQLGVTFYVYPGAVHTRFSHSLGVYHIMKKLSARLSSEGYVSKSDLPLLESAALLHDIGHLPYSHSLEMYYSRSGAGRLDHEDLSREIIVNDESVSEALSKHGVDKHEVASVIEGRHREPLYNQLMSSDLDVDRMDYLVRDSLHTGVVYGSIDLDRLLETITVDKDGNIAVKDKGLIAVENFYISRLHMYRGVYYHKTSLGYELLLARLWGEVIDQIPGLEIFRSFEGLRTAARKGLLKYFDDDWVNGLFYRVATDPSIKAGERTREEIDMFLFRKGYKVCYDRVELIYGDAPSRNELEIMASAVEESVRSRLPGRGGDWSVLINFIDLIPVYREEESVTIVTSEGRGVKIHEYRGSLVGKLPMSVLIHRIYLHPFVAQMAMCG